MAMDSTGPDPPNPQQQQQQQQQQAPQSQQLQPQPSQPPAQQQQQQQPQPPQQQQQPPPPQPQPKTQQPPQQHPVPVVPPPHQGPPPPHPVQQHPAQQHPPHPHPHPHQHQHPHQPPPPQGSPYHPQTHQHPHQSPQPAPYPQPMQPYQHGGYYRPYQPQQYAYHPQSTFAYTPQPWGPQPANFTPGHPPSQPMSNMGPQPQSSVPQPHPSHYQSSPQPHQHQPQQHPSYHHPYGHQGPPPPHAQQPPPPHQVPPPPHQVPPPQQPHQPQPHPMQYHPQVHNPQHAPHAMGPNPYIPQYPHQAPHPHYYPHHPSLMQPPPQHQQPYAVTQPHGPPGAVPPPSPMGPHPQPHPQQAGPIYSPHPPPHSTPHVPPPHSSPHQPPPLTHAQAPHPQAHPHAPQGHPSQPHWSVHGPPPPPHQQGPPPPHPQQHIMQHQPQQIPHPPPPQQTYYQPPQPPHAGPALQPQPQQQPQPQPQQPPPQQLPQQLPPPASPHHPPSRTHTPQHPPTSQTPTRVPPQSSTPASPSSVTKVEKKDIIFPKNSVEATKPVATKKRKMTSKDVTDIEIWRLLMCLKSGLLAESSWAIDVLSILLNDDSTLLHFGLQHMPGLLEAVLEHFKCCLNELFGGIVSDTTLKPVLSETLPVEKLPIKKENGVSSNNNNNNNNHSNNNNVRSSNNNNVNGINTDSKVVINKKKINGAVENISPNIPNLGEPVIMFNTAKNYTFKTRDGRLVKLKNGVTPVQDEPTYELVFKPVGYSHWQEGNGEDTSHIQVFFEPDNFIESSRRCTCLSTIIRNLSFIPGNDVEMSKHAGLLLVLGRLLLLKHNDIILNEAESAPSEWHLLSSLREDTLVIISNISSSLDLSPYNDKINLSLLDGLLHWACCSSSYALDPFPAPSMTVSPQRLALESLAKLSIIEGNVDLILATPPWSRIEKLFEVLARLLNINEDQTIREFSLVLLSNLTSADSGIARKVALTGSAIPRLISFVETSLADPETFATTQDMLRRAAITLKCLSQLVDNHPLFAQHQQRLLNLVMSQKLDPEVVPIIADVIFEISLSD